MQPCPAVGRSPNGELNVEDSLCSWLLAITFRYAGWQPISQRGGQIKTRKQEIVFRTDYPIGDRHTRKRRLRVDPQPYRNFERIKLHPIRKCQTLFDRISGLAGRSEQQKPIALYAGVAKHGSNRRYLSAIELFVQLPQHWF